LNETVNLVTQDDLELIIRRLNPIKKAKYGELLIQVNGGNIVYTKQVIGEQVKMKLNEI